MFFYMKILFVKLTGGCMRPFLKNGQVVYVNLSKKKLKVGDVILYKIDNKFFLHRIVKLSPQNITVTDDSGITSYVSLPYDNVVGVYPTIFSGFIGYIYHIFIRTIYKTLRFIKKLFLYKIFQNRGSRPLRVDYKEG